MIAGPCTSKDPKYNIPKNMHPPAMRLTLKNKHVPFPMITRIFPDSTHISGRQITVTGRQLLQNSTVLYGGIEVSDWGNSTKAFAWRLLNATQDDRVLVSHRWYPLTLNETNIVDSLLDSSLDGREVLVTDEILSLTGHGVAGEAALEVGKLESTITLLRNIALHNVNRTMCDMLDESQLDADLSGLFNFSWVSDTQLSFRTPCERTLPVTDWPEIGDTYRGMRIENLSGDASPSKSDVKQGRLSMNEQFASLVYVTDKCIEPETILLGGRCQPCPTDIAECPGGKAALDR